MMTFAIIVCALCLVFPASDERRSLLRPLRRRP